jgi:hypothetical protein
MSKACNKLDFKNERNNRLQDEGGGLDAAKPFTTPKMFASSKLDAKLNFSVILLDQTN